MIKLKDKTILFGVCLLNFFIFTNNPYSIIPILLVITISSLNSYFERSIYPFFGVTVYVILSLYFNDLVYFLPLLAYDCFLERIWPISLILIIPLSLLYNSLAIYTFLISLVLIFIAYVIKSRSVQLENLKQKYFQLRDEMVEFSRKLEQKNKILMKKQDYEVNLATLNERNRISREIHDSVGHVMSSAILQVGALMATVYDKELKKALFDLKNTLTGGMNSIRKSVHDLYDDSIDLVVQLQKMVNDFSFCPITLDCDIGTIQDTKITYAIIAIVKETMANIMKHSDATQVTLTAREHPGLYQVIVSDNGTPKKINLETGMGLNNIKTRVESLNGILNINTTSGFRVFVSIPKEVKK